MTSSLNEDYRQDILEVTRLNFHTNNADPCLSDKIHFLPWNVMETPINPSPTSVRVQSNQPNVLLMADMFYDEDLSESIVRFLRYHFEHFPNTICYMAMDRRLNCHTQPLLMSEELEKFSSRCSRTPLFESEGGSAMESIFIYAYYEIHILSLLAQPFGADRLCFRLEEVHMSGPTHIRPFTPTSNLIMWKLSIGEKVVK